MCSAVLNQFLMFISAKTRSKHTNLLYSIVMFDVIFFTLSQFIKSVCVNNLKQKKEESLDFSHVFVFQ